VKKNYAPRPDDFVVLVGIPGAGKTTWAQRWRGRAAICSRDDIRRRVFGVEFKETLEPIVSDIFYETLYALVFGEEFHGPVVVDCTHLTRRVRDVVRRIGVMGGRRTVAVVFDLDPEVAWERKKATGSAMSKEAFDRLVASYEPVGSDEGFDEVMRMR